jgi:chitin synthase
MSGQYYELDEQDPEEHIHASADRHTPTYYHQPTHQRTSSYHGSVAGQFPEPEDKPYEYAPQDYQMPLWPEDDHYRMGTPVNVYPGADGSNIYTGVRPPPPPPNPYLQDFPEDPNNPRVSYHQRDSTYSNYGLDENPFHEPSDSEVRPILRPQESQATLGTEKGSKWADVKDVTLKSGNLVLNCPLPDALMNKLPRKAPLEFSCMRYSAVTCDPKDFVEKRFALRQTLFGQPRQTELFIVVTMYNEEENLFARTMAGVFKNIEYMCTKAKDKMWGENAWKKIVVCVVSDGRNKINPKTRSLLALMGCYQEGIAKTKINGEAVQAHIFEVRIYQRPYF